MTKKENLIQLLQELVDSWELAPWLLLLVRDSKEDSDMIGWLLSIIESAITTATDTVAREKLEQAAKKLKEIQKKETLDSIDDQKDAELLLHTF